MTTSDSTVERGSGNVFADLGHPEADAHLLKADLVTRIDTIIRQRGITQTEAARLLGLTQPDVSRLLRGDFREYSLERLFRLLTALGRDIDIVIRQPRSASGGEAAHRGKRDRLTPPSRRPSRRVCCAAGPPSAAPVDRHTRYSLPLQNASCRVREPIARHSAS